MKSVVRPELPTASVASSQAPTAALDNSAPPLTTPESTYKSGKSVQTTGATSKELPEVIKEHKIKIRDDRDDMRGFYANHRYPQFPSPDLIDEQWAYFRWIQVYLLAGLDFINRYGVNVVPSEEKMIHELIDLDYLIPAILVGGLACREKIFLERFRLLRSDGIVLR